MRLPIWQIDAFTKGAFGGNPAAIVRVEDWLPAELMQAIATENNQTTTAFLRCDDGGFALRWFTPTIEEPVCTRRSPPAPWCSMRSIRPSTP